MNVQIKYFASVREALGAGESVEVGERASVGELRDQLIGRGGQYAEVLARGRALRMALNQTLCDEAAVLMPGAEVAFFPPVTGG